MDFTSGLGKIYSNEEIEKAKKSPSFPREYQLQYQGLIGKVFSTKSIESCQNIEYNPDNIIQDAKKSIGLKQLHGKCTVDHILSLEVRIDKTSQPSQPSPLRACIH